MRQRGPGHFSPKRPGLRIHTAGVGEGDAFQGAGVNDDSVTGQRLAVTGMALAAYGNLQALPIGVLNGFHDVVRRSRPHYGAWYAFEIPGNIHGELPAGGLIQKDGSFKLGIIVQWQFLFQQRREFFSIESEDPLIAAA